MLLIENDHLYQVLSVIHMNQSEQKFLYLALFDVYGRPLDPNIPKTFTGLKKVEFLPGRFVFHDFGGNSFAILQTQQNKGSFE